VLGVEDVLGDRGLRFPPGHWGLNAVTWRRSTSPADIAVPDAGRLAPGAGMSGHRCDTRTHPRCRGRTSCSRTAFSSRSLGFDRSDLEEKYVPGGHRSPRCGRLAAGAGVRRGAAAKRGRTL